MTKNNDDECCKVIAKAWDMFKDLPDDEMEEAVLKYKESLIDRFPKSQMDRCARQLIAYVEKNDDLPRY